MTVMGKIKKVKTFPAAANDDVLENDGESNMLDSSAKKLKKKKLKTELKTDNSLLEKSADKKKNKSHKNKFKLSELNGEVIEPDISKEEVSKVISNEVNGDKTNLTTEDATATKKGGKGSIVKSAKFRLKDDLAYFNDFMSFIHIPQHRIEANEEDDDDDGPMELTDEIRERLHLNRKPEDRASSREELQERLRKKIEELRGSYGPNDKKKAKKLKRRMAALEKGKENKELKQKLMEIGINAGGKKTLAADVESMGATLVKPGVKTDKGVVFSKFDFQEMEKEKKKNLDPQAALKKIQKSKEKIKLWEEKGRTEKVKNIESSIAWDNALGKAKGEKVKDDEALLKKSIKKKQQIKESKKKKWEARVETMENKMASAKGKRDANISKRKKDKKDKKLKHAVAKGRHVPGF